MMHFNIVCVGKIKDFLLPAINEYSTRLRKYCSLSVVEIAEAKSECVKKESEEIMKKLSGFVVLCDLGGENHVGLGSDFDGIDEYPEGLRNAGDIPALLERMRQRGFSEALVRKVAGENFAAYLNIIDGE